MRRFLEHHLNPLHVYCRLRGFGLRGWARTFSAFYERHIYRRILPRR
ncbi:hypothetical protein GGQ74_001153 [Desulfobaculum xiamenense]|uniref:Uncharacterized protein n=1 Tax=Desulfobaculum xiamenense TaxID=995050 RepID=A0A846QMP4_9BACT|nr:hypothetical protein [Desulfobaculum xiamenense]